MPGTAFPSHLVAVWNANFAFGRGHVNMPQNGGEAGRRDAFWPRAHQVDTEYLGMQSHGAKKRVTCCRRSLFSSSSLHPLSILCFTRSSPSSFPFQAAVSPNKPLSEQASVRTSLWQLQTVLANKRLHADAASDHIHIADRAPSLSRKLDLLDNEQLKESSDFITDYYTRVIHHRHGWAYHHAWILVLGAVFVA
ncbi:hypothetical protein JHW43_000028 [Diplocarpon mali]|nr:hypothetical protein JHW43_000028 [Diplocarpon mali]